MSSVSGEDMRSQTRALSSEDSTLTEWMLSDTTFSSFTEDSGLNLMLEGSFLMVIGPRTSGQRKPSLDFRCTYCGVSDTMTSGINGTLTSLTFSFFSVSECGDSEPTNVTSSSSIFTHCRLTADSRLADGTSVSPDNRVRRLCLVCGAGDEPSDVTRADEDSRLCRCRRVGLSSQ